MVQQYKARSQYDIPYSLLCPVYFYRYPNPLATHVLSVDVLSREIVKRSISETSIDEQHILKTTRLILKKGTLPSWAPKGLIKNAESWVLEESEIELDSINASVLEQRGGKGREMRAWTRNLDHTTVMAVTESTIFRERIKGNRAGRNNGDAVRLKSIYDVTSGVSFSLLRGRIEKFGINRVLTHIDTSRQGILTTYARFLEEKFGSSDSSGTLVLPTENQKISRKAKLLAALRPPFLDGDFVGPIARAKQRFIGVREWWRGLDRGGSGHESANRIQSRDQDELKVDNKENLTPMERIRKRLLKLRAKGRTALQTQSVDNDDDDDF